MNARYMIRVQRTDVVWAYVGPFDSLKNAQTYQSGVIAANATLTAYIYMLTDPVKDRTAESWTPPTESMNINNERTS